MADLPTDAEQLGLAKRIFLEVCELPLPARDDAILRACEGREEIKQAVLNLLAAEDKPLAFETLAEDIRAAADSMDTRGEGPRDSDGTRIGRYRLLERIGEGGFGVVYMAEQTEPVRRMVALKILKLGMDTRNVIARFEAERQALAMMDHPGIARVFDAGATSTGRPYFVMELVRGDPITTYADRKRLTLRERLELFAQVCRSVQHAHQKGVIHRDLKPSNVLVVTHDDKPAPKIIDFGIAKATSGRLTEKTVFTEFRQMLGTPEYMSPEQAENGLEDVDTRSDVYSLGVILYELLVGAPPFDSKRLRSAAYGELQRIIREVDAPRPSTRLKSLDTLPSVAAVRRTEPARLTSSLRGELDWIVMKCLEKARDRRYSSAAEIAQEIQRYLDKEPVMARPPSAGYRASKFYQRNRGLVISGVVVLVLLVGGLAGTSFGLVQAQAQRNKAERLAISEAEQHRLADERATEAEDARRRAETAEREATTRLAQLERIADFQAQQLSTLKPAEMARKLRESILTAAPLDRRTALEAELEPINFTNITLESLDRDLFGKTIKSIDAQFAEQPELHAYLLQETALTLLQLGMLARMEDPQKRALAIYTDLFGEDAAETIDSLIVWAAFLRESRRYDEAENTWSRIIQWRESHLGVQHRDTIEAIAEYGVTLSLQQRFSDALVYFEEAMERARAALGDTDAVTIDLMRGVIDHHRLSGRPPEECAELRTTLVRASRERVAQTIEEFGPTSEHTVADIMTLGADIWAAEGHTDEVVATFREAYELGMRALGPHNEATLGSLERLSGVLSARGEHDKAAPLAQLNLKYRRELLGDEHVQTLFLMAQTASELMKVGQWDEAASLLRLSYYGNRKILGENPDRTTGAMQLLTEALRAEGKSDELESLWLDCYDNRRRTLGPDHALTLTMVQQLTMLYESESRLGDEVRFRTIEVEILERTFGPEHELTKAETTRLKDRLSRLEQQAGE